MNDYALCAGLCGLMLVATSALAADVVVNGVPPTGKRVELPIVVVMKFEKGKIAHERIYWDQAWLLVQVGLLDTMVPSGHWLGTGADSSR